MARWFRDELRSAVAEELDAGVPWIDRDTTRELIETHQTAKADFARPLWTLYVLVGWFRAATRWGTAAPRS